MQASCWYYRKRNVQDHAEKQKLRESPADMCVLRKKWKRDRDLAISPGIFIVMTYIAFSPAFFSFSFIFLSERSDDTPLLKKLRQLLPNEIGSVGRGRLQNVKSRKAMFSN